MIPTMERKALATKSQAKKHVDISKMSKNMEYILHQEAKTRGIEPSLMKSNDFSHIIIKAVQDDEKMYLVAMMKRLQQCCPLREEDP